MIEPNDTDTTGADGPRWLGHGDHWEAVGFEFVERMQEIFDNALLVGEFPPPWPSGPCEVVAHMEWKLEGLGFAVLFARNEAARSYDLLSGFPYSTAIKEWVVNVVEPLDAYGAIEGVVSGEAAAGHSLEWFAPRFGFDSVKWRKPGLARVGLAGLALSVRRFAAESFEIKEGPLIEMRREELRAEGKLEEAERADLSVTVHTDGMRTLYSSTHDHCAFIGKVLGMEDVEPLSGMRGWRMALECMPDESESGSVLPLLVFPPALEDGYEPKKDDLVQGVLWLQGVWMGTPTKKQVKQWKADGGSELAI